MNSKELRGLMVLLISLIILDISLTSIVLFILKGKELNPLINYLGFNNSLILNGIAIIYFILVYWKVNYFISILNQFSFIRKLFDFMSLLAIFIRSFCISSILVQFIKLYLL